MHTDDHGLGLVFRDLRGEDELEQCVTLQRATWGDDFRELVPPAMLTVSQKVGGILIGAFEPDGRLAGFVFGLTGTVDHKPAHWSHMMAVRQDLRDRGIGQALKRAQQQRLLTEGISWALWTYDPLVARNAHVNLNRLGTRVLEYVPNMYGENPMSKTDSVIGSDRFVVGWDLNEGVVRPVAVRGDAPSVDLTGTATTEAPLPSTHTVLVHIPDDIQNVKQRDPQTAVVWRRVTRRALTHYLASGYRVTGFQRRSGSSAYVVERTDSPRA